MDLDNLRGMRVAVTGASGFVGGRLARALLTRGAQVHAYGRRPGLRLEGMDFRSWDIGAGPLASAPRVDVVVHCAGMVTDWADRESFLTCHVTGTRHVLNSFPEPCAVVHVSTASVYDLLGDKRALNEQAPEARRHLNAYCETKAAAEQLVLARRQAIVLRPHAIYGPGDRVLLPRLLDACRGGYLIAAGNGANRVSLTHVDNLVDAILLALRAVAEGRASGVYNIADDSPVKMDDALRAVLAAAGRHPRVVYLPRAPAYALGATLEFVHAALALRSGPRLTRYRVVQIADDFTLDLTRARRDLGYRPLRDLMSFVNGDGLGPPQDDPTLSTSSRP